MNITRRQLLAGTGAATVAAATAGVTSRLGAFAASSGALPTPNTSGLDHIVFVCMENRSFDHFLGWLSGADGKQAGLSYPDDHGVLHPTHHLAPDWQGCGFNDPDHSYAGGRRQFNGGKCDGFRKSPNDDYAIGYYTEADLPLYGPLLKVATTFDRYFCSILGPTYPNRFYTHAAYTDRLDNYMRFSTLPTIWDRLAGAGVSAHYYFGDTPFIGLWGQKYISIAERHEAFFAAAASGTLPSFSYIDPYFLGEDQGASNDDHPHADIRRGQAFISEIALAMVNSPLWSKSALVVTYDEWGGFFDHVAPPLLPDDHDPHGLTHNEHSRAGFRVPAIVLSPFARRGYVGHNVYDHTSVLKMLEWRFGLTPLTARDAAARNLAEALDFAHPDASVPSLPIVPDPGPQLCGASPASAGASAPVPTTDEDHWADLREMLRTNGWSSKL